jgi:hypothetical protein
MADRVPRVLLHIEGLAIALAAIALYFHAGYPWWLLVALAHAPGLSGLGDKAGAKVGAMAYDDAHTLTAPVVLAALGVLLDGEIGVQLGLIWLIHIGVDRAAGYGLKYPTGFKDTHLQRV